MSWGWGWGGEGLIQVYICQVVAWSFLLGTAYFFSTQILDLKLDPGLEMEQRLWLFHFVETGDRTLSLNTLAPCHGAASPALLSIFTLRRYLTRLPRLAQKRP